MSLTSPSPVSINNRATFVLSMDRCSFEAWMEEVISKLVQLDHQQTKMFFQTFTKMCSSDQKLYLETEMKYLLSRDFLTLPSLVVDRILGYLDVKSFLIMRLVCRNWRDTITGNERLWRDICWQKGGNIQSCSNVRPEFFFRMHQGLRFIVHQMECKTAFLTVLRNVCPQTLSEPLTSFSCSRIAYRDGILAVGTRDRRLLTFNAETNELLWEKMGNVASCLYLTNDLLIAGTHWGQLRIISLDGHFQYEKLFGCNTVTALDVHDSGHFLLAGFCDGSVRFIGPELSDNCVIVDSLKRNNADGGESKFLEPAIKKVFFLPDTGLLPNHLAFCVCTKQSMMIAVMEKTGAVKESHLRPWPNKVLNFCSCKSDLHILYASIQLSPTSVGIVRYDMRPAEPPATSMYSLEKKDLLVEEAVYLSFSTFNIHILAAGKRFMIAVVISDLVIFDLVTCKRIATVNCLFPILDMLKSEHSPDCMAAVDMEWLDGLAPINTQPNKPIMLCGINSRGCSDFKLFTLKWSPQVWKHWALCQTCDAHMHCLLYGCHCHGEHDCGTQFDEGPADSSSHPCSQHVDQPDSPSHHCTHHDCHGNNVKVPRLFGDSSCSLDISITKGSCEGFGDMTGHAADNRLEGNPALSATVCSSEAEHEVDTGAGRDMQLHSAADYNKLKTISKETARCKDCVSASPAALGMWRNASLFKEKADQIVAGQEEYDLVSKDGVVLLD